MKVENHFWSATDSMQRAKRTLSTHSMCISSHPPSQPKRPTFSKSSSSSTSQGMKTFRTANIDFVKEGILGPLIDRAARLGEGIIAARVRQAEFESRLLPKPALQAKTALVKRQGEATWLPCKII